MNDQVRPVASDHAVVLDPENPWLGLFSYTEETRTFFYGRDEETAELARRVQNKILTVLFGQSGLGKTSLLRAGLVPRLRKEGYCPVYVRIDYAAGSPTAAEQIKRAVFRATQEAGHWTRPGASIEGESLWEFLHHRGDLLRDADGHPLTPLLIFDQFEEIFTLGQADDAGKQRAQQFLDDLADLVENRAPAALEARMEQDDNAAEDFDFGRADYRVLITLREDYLAFLEGVKDTMPAITQNRMRLARMTGEQALSAVVKPGGKLVTPEVAEAIVRFVAGGAELKNAEIEPSLLSLVCRELNTIRQTQKRKEISTDLLAGSRETILSEFYERSLADQPEGVRRVIEDELLTESGYRESIAEERVLKSLADAGAGPDALATLVNRRLMRVEERLDMRRVELTHDVLCSVVRASRNLRHEREMRDAAKRQLAEQQAREAATHRTLRRTQIIAGVCIVLLVIAAIGASFGFYSLHRARTAEDQAQASRANAEKLVSFLIEDFYTELAPTGRLETLGKLAQKTVGYYDSLPPALRTKQTQINRAMAIVREGTAQNSSGKTDAAYKNLGNAQAVFEKLRAAGDHGEAVTYGLALALYSEGFPGAVGGGNGRGTPGELQRAAALLRPLAYTPAASRRVRQLYADTLNVLSFDQSVQTSVATCDEARKIFASLGALDLSDLEAASSYADTADTESRHLLTLGRIAEARKLEQQVYDLASKILVRRPGDLHAMADRTWSAELLSTLAGYQHDDAASADYANKAAQSGEDEVRFNPSDLGAWQRWALGLRAVAEQQIESGEITRGIATLRSVAALEQDPRRPSSLGPVLWFEWSPLAYFEAQTGDKLAAAQSLQHLISDIGESIAQSAPDNPRRQLFAGATQGIRGGLELAEGLPQAALADATSEIARVDAVKFSTGDMNSVNVRDNILNNNLDTAAKASLQLGRYPHAEKLARRWLAIPANPTSEADPQSRKSEILSVLANAVAMQDRGAEAQKVLEPALAYYHEQQQAGAQGTRFRGDYAYALYVDAIAQPADPAGHEQRQTDLTEGAKQIAGAAAEVQRLADMRSVSGLIVAARSGTDK